jgi:phosphoribosylpyrophosphate synthetase
MASNQAFNPLSNAFGALASAQGLVGTGQFGSYSSLGGLNKAFLEVLDLVNIMYVHRLNEIKQTQACQSITDELWKSAISERSKVYFTTSELNLHNSDFSSFFPSEIKRLNSTATYIIELKLPEEFNETQTMVTSVVPCAGAKKNKRALLEQLKGKYAHVNVHSQEFAARKYSNSELEGEYHQ